MNKKKKLVSWYMDHEIYA